MLPRGFSLPVRSETPCREQRFGRRGKLRPQGLGNSQNLTDGPDWKLFGEVVHSVAAATLHKLVNDALGLCADLGLKLCQAFRLKSPPTTRRNTV